MFDFKIYFFRFDVGNESLEFESRIESPITDVMSPV